MFLHQHAGGLLLGPWSCQALGTVGDPETGERHDRCIAKQKVGIHFVEGVDLRVVRVLVVGRILIEIDSRQTGENERAGIGAEFDVIICLDFAEGLDGSRKGLDCRNEVVTSAELQADDGALPVIQDHRRDVVGHLLLVHLYVSQRAEQALLFSGEQNKTHGAFRTEAGFHDGFSGAERGRDAHTVIGCALGQIP